MNETTRKHVIDFLLIAGGAVVVYFAVHKFFFLLFPISLALIFSEAIRKSFRRLKPLSEGVKRILIVLVLLIFFALLSLIVILFTERLIHTITEFSAEQSKHFDRILAFFQESVHSVENFFSRLLRRDLENSVTSHLPGMLRQFSQKLLESVPSFIKSITSAVPRFFVSLFIFVISTYYFSCDWNRLSSWCSKLISPQKRETLSRTKEHFFRALQQYGKAYFLLFLLTFTELFLGLVILKTEGAAGKAFLIALVDILPVLGCGTVLVPWALITLIFGNSTRAIGLIVLYLIILFIRQILEPKIVGDSIGLHPVLSLILVIAGLSFFGFFGMFFLPLLGTCLLQSLRESEKKENR